MTTHFLEDEMVETTLCDDRDLEAMIQDLARIILSNDLSLKDTVLVGILGNGYPIAERLSKYIYRQTNHKIPVGKLDVSVYRDDIESLGQFITLRGSDIPCDIEQRTVILIDDVIHHGRTARAALNALLDFGRPKSIQLGVLFDRGSRDVPIQPNYTVRQITLDDSMCLLFQC